MQKIITKIGLFRGIVKEFQCEVNCHLAQGWKILDLDIDKKGLRLICWAILDKSNGSGECCSKKKD